ncbi:hypothetical protein QF038_000823 [Pseudarthrobacter sp. W1I19]|uniref:hypothetical protein n=1 Tax=Pseudarthrobacter sp. W1I19 TaxID=3042288 RepID=UPI00277EF888|nr:hypothetical protein [Pseudarthrobacter sp. W1I19]MDQ0922315.1 hypothetical protein [Pseudarthrobacter sp. W1I19]
MVKETEQSDSAERNDRGVKRRGLLRFGTLVTAFTGASAVSAMAAKSAQAAPGDKTLPNTYVPVAEKGSPSGVATLDATAKLIPTQLPDLSATYGSEIERTGSPAQIALAKRDILNIIDFGVSRGTAASQTVAIKAALDANPGKTFYFPPGDYRFDTPLLIDKQNSLIIDGTLIAWTSMADFITFDPDLVPYLYAEGKFITGKGTIDANLKVDRAIVVNQVIGFELGDGLTIKNAIKRFLYTGPIGAQMLTHNLTLLNTTDTNVEDNVGIEANMGDCHFRDVFARDITVFAKDFKANLWEACHPWIGPNWSGGQQMTSRYPSSIGFDLTGPSTLRGCIADTFRTHYMIRSNGTAYTERPNFLDCRATWASSLLPIDLATAYPGAVFDNTAGVGAVIDRTRVSGLTAAPQKFLNGPATNVDSRNNKNQGYVVGEQGTTADSLEYRGGIQQGGSNFTPTIYGSMGAGVHSYGTRTGRMVVNGDTATYFIRIQATLDSTTAFAGSLRIGGIPLPSGSTNVRDGAGIVGKCSNVQASTAVVYSGTAPAITLLSPVTATGTAEVDIPGQALRGKVVDLMISVTVTHFKA